MACGLLSANAFSPRHYAVSMTGASVIFGNINSGFHGRVSVVDTLILTSLLLLLEVYGWQQLHYRQFCRVFSNPIG